MLHHLACVFLTRNDFRSLTPIELAIRIVVLTEKIVLKIFKILDETNKYVTTVTTRNVIMIYLELGGSYTPLVSLYLKKPPWHLLVKGQNVFFFASFLFF